MYVFIYLTADSTISVFWALSVLMSETDVKFRNHPECPTLVVTSKPCQSAQTRELVCMRNVLAAMTHPSRVLNLDMKNKALLCQRAIPNCIHI